MIRSEKMILRETDEIAKWISDATAIYNQALYYLRQEYFDSQKNNQKPNYSKIDLYKLLKESDCWKTSDLDINAKQYVIRKVRDNWNSFYKACKTYWKDKSKFNGLPRIPKYLKNGRTSILIFEKIINLFSFYHPRHLKTSVFFHFTELYNIRTGIFF